MKVQRIKANHTTGGGFTWKRRVKVNRSYGKAGAAKRRLAAKKHKKGHQ